MAKRYESLEDRILANSVLSVESVYRDPVTGEVTGCWVWLGKTIASRGASRNRYPALTMRTRKGGTPANVRVHRLVLEVFRGLKPPTRAHVAAHGCNNSLCVNPMHLRWATEKQNMKQCVRDGRHVSGTVARDFDRLDEAA